MIKLIHGDCLEKMRDIPDKSVDMVLCDLPYGVTQNKVDVVIPFDRLWEQYDRIVKDNGPILLFAQGLFYVDLVNSNRKDFRYDLVWDKILTTGFLNANRMPLRRHEQIGVFYKEPPVYNPQMVQGQPNHSRKPSNETAKVNKNYASFKVIDCKYDGLKHPTSILEFQKPHPSSSLHPTEKSLELIEYLIKTYSNEGDTILDNTMGSGTTGVGCFNTKRNFIGIEKEDEYFEVAVKRLKETIPFFDKSSLIIVDNKD